ncbi:MAG: nucleoside-diphosphate kinase [Candidatus Saccharimonadia bacterium]
MKYDPEKLEQIRHERTLVVFKPDAVMRKIIGELLTRFERKGLKIVALKMIWPTHALAEKHYIDSEEWLLDTGTKTYNNYLENGVQPDITPREIGLNTRRKLMDHLTAGPVVAMILEGAHAIEVVRRMRGATNPLKADVGTIGFDYTLESYELSDAGDWAIKNVLHASDSVANYERERDIWFDAKEIVNYDTAIDQVLYSNNWFQKRSD